MPKLWHRIPRHCCHRIIPVMTESPSIGSAPLSPSRRMRTKTIHIQQHRYIQQRSNRATQNAGRSYAIFKLCKTSKDIILYQTAVARCISGREPLQSYHGGTAWVVAKFSPDFPMFSRESLAHATHYLDLIPFNGNQDSLSKPRFTSRFICTLSEGTFRVTRG